MNGKEASSLWQHFPIQKNVLRTVPKTIQGFSIGNEERDPVAICEYLAINKVMKRRSWRRLVGWLVGCSCVARGSTLCYYLIKMGSAFGFLVAAGARFPAANAPREGRGKGTDPPRHCSLMKLTDGNITFSIFISNMNEHSSILTLISK